MSRYPSASSSEIPGWAGSLLIAPVPIFSRITPSSTCQISRPEPGIKASYSSTSSQVPVPSPLEKPICSGSIHTRYSGSNISDSTPSGRPRLPRCCLFSSRKYSSPSIGTRTALGKSPSRSVASSATVVSRCTTSGSIHPSLALVQAIGWGGAKPTTGIRLSCSTKPSALAPTSIRLQPPTPGSPSAKFDRPGNPSWWPKNLAINPFRPATPRWLGDSGRIHPSSISNSPSSARIGPPA